MVIKRKSSSSEALDLKVDLANFKNETKDNFESLENKINHLPTKDEFYLKMDEVVGELQKLREEVTITSHHYDKTNKRVDIIDKHLRIDTSTVF